MTSGSMHIKNYLGKVTTLKVDGITAIADEENSLFDARAALGREKSSPSPNNGNIAFLTHWIRLATEAGKVTTRIGSSVPSSVPPKVTLPTYKLGKNPPVIDGRTLKFRKYAKDLKPPPQFTDYESAVISFPMMGNDQLGDCVAAAAGHMIQNWSAYSGKDFTPTLEDIITFYEFSGYNPNDPSTDQGWELLPALKAWRNFGIAGHKITAFVQLETGNFEQLRQAIALFGNAYLGFALPDFVVPLTSPIDWTQIPWIWQEGAVPNPSNGHCVPAMGYNKKKWVNFVSWAARMGMDEEFYKNSSDEAFAVLSPDWIEMDGLSPSGFDTEQLLKDLAEL